MNYGLARYDSELVTGGRVFGLKKQKTKPPLIKKKKPNPWRSLCNEGYAQSEGLSIINEWYNRKCTKCYYKYMNDFTNREVERKYVLAL